MSVVVERGLARCPRCVAVADYTFIESGPNSLSYEVHCRRCGEAYREVHAPFALDFAAAVDALVVLPPSARRSAFALRRQHVAGWLAGLRDAAQSRMHYRSTSSGTERPIAA